MANTNKGLDLSQVFQQIAGNPDLLGQLQGMKPSDTKGATKAAKNAGIPVSAEQMSGIMAQLPKLMSMVDTDAVMKGVDLSDGFDMKDVQGMLGGLMGGGKK